MKPAFFGPLFLLMANVPMATAAADDPSTTLPATERLEQAKPLDVRMVEGIDRHALDAIEAARIRRLQLVPSSQLALETRRRELAVLIGAVEPRVKAAGIELLGTASQPSLVFEDDRVRIDAARWPAFAKVSGEGLLIRPKGSTVARVVAIPDADWTPEMVAGIEAGAPPFAMHLARMGCEVLVPTLISRDDTYSANPAIGRATNQTHREFIYRQAFELGRHVIGYEVDKIRAGIDQLTRRNLQSETELPIAVIGVGEGGLLAFHSAALDPRVDMAFISGYFDRREQVWQEPIYRNVWKILIDHGDAEIASLIAPRRLWIEASPSLPTISGPPPVRDGRRGAAPGVIRAPTLDSVRSEWQRAAVHWQRQGTAERCRLVGTPGATPLSPALLRDAMEDLTGKELTTLAVEADPKSRHDLREGFTADERQHRQVAQLVEHTQTLLRHCHLNRESRLAKVDRQSVAGWVEAAEQLRDEVHRDLIGKIEDTPLTSNTRSRLVIDDPNFVGYEVELDVFQSVIAGGILLLPKDLGPSERRPVVVCQHGLEGTPMHTITRDPQQGFRAYKAFSAALARQGFIVYAPQNPYRGKDAFRTLQRKSNPLGRTLFSYIVAQHKAQLRWLASQPHVDAQRIGFYGLSYGGKTAVRVPPLIPPRPDQPGYALSICSADFNEWVAKNASTDAPFSYLWTGEYEIFEWDMGNIANYAELSMLMAPRPFMVERGHDDGVGIDEWVAWEFAKVRRHYNKLGIGERTEIEFFDGPHTINGQGTYDFLHRHLNWPRRDTR